VRRALRFLLAISHCADRMFARENIGCSSISLTVSEVCGTKATWQHI
jgi:hypothetical protein